MAKKCLITGVPGWLSSRLVLAMTGRLETVPYASAYDVRALSLPESDLEALNVLEVDPYFADLTRPAELTGAFRNVDVVVHTAGIIHPKKARDFFTVNAEGTRNALNAAIAAGSRRFIHISSNAPFGFNQSGHRPFDEQAPYDPYQGYGRSKLEAEQAVREAGGKIETVILRPCWFYGPGQPERQTRFFKMIQSGRPVLFGDGMNLRSMSYVDNTVQAILLALDSPKANGQAYWIADRRPYRTLEIYWTIADILRVPLKVRRLPAIVSKTCRVVDDVLQRANAYVQEIHVAGEMDQHIMCDISKATADLGYQPSLDLERGMRESLDWCRRMNYISF